MLHRHGEREMGHAGIAGFLQDPGQAQLRIIAHIANTMAIEDERMGIHHAVWLDNPCCSAVMITSGLTVDPGSKVSLMARLRKSSSVALSRLFGLKSG